MLVQEAGDAGSTYCFVPAAHLGYRPGAGLVTNLCDLEQDLEHSSDGLEHPWRKDLSFGKPQSTHLYCSPQLSDNSFLMSVNEMGVEKRIQRGKEEISLNI